MRNQILEDKKTPGKIRHAACTAEPAIVHLETVIRHCIQSGQHATLAALNAHYWLSRITDLHARFDLLAPQKVRLARLTDQLTTALAVEGHRESTMGRRAA